MKSRVVLFAALSLLLASCKEESGKLQIAWISSAEPYVSTPESKYPAISSAGDCSKVAFRVSGTIKNVLVSPGEKVKKGTPLVKLDDRDYKIQLNATQAEYNQIKAQVDRVMAMYEDNAVSQNDYDKARYGLEQISQKLAHHRDQYEDCTLTSPIDGYVGDLFFNSGETVVSGIPVISVIGSGKACLTINISAKDYKRIDAFESVTARFSSIPGREFPLKIKSVAKKANSNQLYCTELEMTEGQEEITPGMSAMVSIRYKSEDGGKVLVPTNAIFQNQDGTGAVFRYDKTDSTITAVSVEVVNILHNGKSVIQGIESGAEIVSAGVPVFKDGQKVIKAATPSANNPGGML